MALKSLRSAKQAARGAHFAGKWIYDDTVRRCVTTRSSTCRLLWTKAPPYCGPPPIAAPEGRHSCRAHTRRFHQGILEPESTGDRLSKVPHELSSLFLHAQSLLFFSTARSAYFSRGVRSHIKTCCQPYPVSSSLTLYSILAGYERYVETLRRDSKSKQWRQRPAVRRQPQPVVMTCTRSTFP